MAEAAEASIDDDAYELDGKRVLAIVGRAAAGDSEGLKELLDPLHPADIADLLEQVDADERQEIVSVYGAEMDGEILSELEESIREDVIAAMPPEVLAEAVRELESDDVVDLLENVEEEQADTILAALDAAGRVAVEQSLSYPEESAGRLMQREVVTVPRHWSVGHTIDFMRSHDDLPDQFYHITLVDPRMRPVGDVTLGRLMSSGRDVKLADITESSFRTFRVDEPEEDVAYAFNQYHLISAPVVDENERIVGVVTIDDAMTILDEEAEEDILRLAGVGDETVADRTLKIVRQRFPWLLVNLGTAILASMVIGQFDFVLTQIVALAILMPIVASMGGNAGTQSMTVAVRALATRDLTGSNAWRVVRREMTAGLINGALFGVIVGVVGYFWFGTAMLGVVIGAAMVVNMLVAGLAGVLIPIVLDKIGVDPALASGTFVTTVTDVIGFFAFLGLAALVLL